MVGLFIFFYFILPNSGMFLDINDWFVHFEEGIFVHLINTYFDRINLSIKIKIPSKNITYPILNLSF